ncbi:MAG: GxxExxY protein, partial [Clostridiales bacterium]|nr:GxxExxY protein [Clostridiales bacterium]
MLRIQYQATTNKKKLVLTGLGGIILNHEIYEKILYRDETFQIQGAIFEVYKEMGCGFLEAVYQECLEIEFTKRQIPFVSQRGLKIFYKEEPLSLKYVPDLICYDKIIIELKAVRDIVPEHKAQILNYLKATSMNLGLLVNFGAYPKV